MAFIISSPSITGIFTSLMIRSGIHSRNLASPSFPSDAVAATTSSGHFFSIIPHIYSNAAGSSSTTKTRNMIRFHLLREHSWNLFPHCQKALLSPPLSPGPMAGPKDLRRRQKEASVWHRYLKVPCLQIPSQYSYYFPPASSSSGPYFPQAFGPSPG